MLAPVETPVRHGQQAELGERDRAAWLPEPSLEPRLEWRRQRTDRRVVGAQRNERERQSEKANHDAERKPVARGRVTSNGRREPRTSVGEERLEASGLVLELALRRP